ncbi:phage terminase small subunit [Virgibacillus oceani]
MAKWEEIRGEWETSKITLASLAEKHNVKLGTLKSRKSREKWSRDATKKDATKQKVATPQKNQRYKPGSRKGAGNPNPVKKFTERNSAAVKHGLFSRYIPKETLEIMDMLNKEDPADLIWDQIQIQYAAIIRAQEIMFVEDKGEIIKEVKKEKEFSSESGGGSETEWEFQFAWDRQASFLNAQSRAISELRTSIKQFLEMAHDDDERRLKLELMQANIDKSKAEAEKLSKEQGEDIEEIVIVDEWGDDND